MDLIFGLFKSTFKMLLMYRLKFVFYYMRWLKKLYNCICDRRCFIAIYLQLQIYLLGCVNQKIPELFSKRSQFCEFDMPTGHLIKYFYHLALQIYKIKAFPEYKMFRILTPTKLLPHLFYKITFKVRIYNIIILKGPLKA